MRIYAVVGAVLGWFALVLQLYLMLVQAPAGGVVATVITFFSFFTILTNLLVAVVLTSVALRTTWGSWFRQPSVQAASAVYIAIVGAIYQLLLRHLWNPQGAQWVADFLLHSVIPVGYVLDWVLFAPRGGLRWKDTFKWLIYPGVYLLYVLVRGALTGTYPYPFVDVTALGYGGVFVRVGMFLLLFLGAGLLALAVGRILERIWGRSPA
jgi:hypothetical protein